jgi:UDP-N-acetylglucosamine transferase subunit ALG13
MPFDELLEEVDRLAESGVLAQPLVTQYGQSSYRMRHGEQFAGRPGLQDLIDKSSLVITHGGSTVIQLLLSNKPFVAFPNPRGAGDHQTAFLRQVSSVVNVSWSQSVCDLEGLYKNRLRMGASLVDNNIPKASVLIDEFVRMKL